MKAESISSTRTIRFSEINPKVEGLKLASLPGELTVTLNHVASEEWGMIQRGVVLDNCVIPAICNAFNGIRSIVVLGREWFRESNGSTYHSASVIVDGEQVARVNYSYGSGNQYLITAFNILEDALGYKLRTENELPWSACVRLGIKLHYEMTKVGRKEDL